MILIHFLYVSYSSSFVVERCIHLFFFLHFPDFLLLPKMLFFSGEGAGEQVRFVGNEKINGKVCRADVSAVNLRRVIM